VNGWENFWDNENICIAFFAKMFYNICPCRLVSEIGFLLLFESEIRVDSDAG
jgi:hypothetical protein